MIIDLARTNGHSVNVRNGRNTWIWHDIALYKAIFHMYLEKSIVDRIGYCVRLCPDLVIRSFRKVGKSDMYAIPVHKVRVVT